MSFSDAGLSEEEFPDLVEDLLGEIRDALDILSVLVSLLSFLREYRSDLSLIDAKTNEEQWAEASLKPRGPFPVSKTKIHEVLSDGRVTESTLLPIVRGLARALDEVHVASFAGNLLQRWYASNGEQLGDGQFRVRAGDPVLRDVGPRNQYPESRASIRIPDATSHVVLAGPEVNQIDVTLDFRLDRDLFVAEKFERGDSRDIDLAIVKPLIDSAIRPRCKAAPAPDTDHYAEQVIEILRQAASNGAELAVLPEGASSASLRNKLLSRLQEDVRPGDVPAIVILGSEISNRTGENLIRNESWAVVSALNIALKVASKNRGARPAERIEPRKRLEVSIFVVGATKISTVICSDAEIPQILAVLHSLYVEKICVPAFSTKPSREFSQILAVSSATGGSVVVSNGMPKYAEALFSSSGVDFSIRSQKDQYGWAHASPDAPSLTWNAV